MMLALLSVVSFAMHITWEDCSDTSYLAKIENMSIKPNPFNKGDTVVISGSGHVNETVSGGQFHCSATAFKHSGPICSDSDFDLPFGIGHVTVKGLTCPVTGELTITQQMDVKTKLHFFSHTMRTIAVDQGNGNLICLDITMHPGTLVEDDDMIA